MIVISGAIGLLLGAVLYPEQFKSTASMIVKKIRK